MYRLTRDESGMTMGLVVIMIVLIGVMGAGLLTFVQRDLQTVVEVNKGQSAFELADAGAQLAKRHLLLDNVPAHHDIDDSTDPDYFNDGCNVPGADVSEATPVVDGDWSLNGSQTGTVKNVASGQQIRVSVRWLSTDATADARCKAPVASAPLGTRYFRIISTGTFNGATRRVEAIYQTTPSEFPIAYYSTRNINFNGGAASVNGVSLFAGNDVTNVDATRISGDDQAYGDWRNNPDGITFNKYNGQARLGNNPPRNVASSDYRAPKAAGIAAENQVTYTPETGNGNGRNGNARQDDGTAPILRIGKVDFDSTSPDKTFSANTWGAIANQPSAKITYPFETDNAVLDQEIIDTWREIAIAQDNYQRITNGNAFMIKDGNDDSDAHERYPKISTLQTVFFVEYTGNPDPAPDVTFKVDTSNQDDINRGIVVVVDGDLDTSASSDSFEGAFVVRDTDDTNSPVLTYKNTGSLNVRGFANIEGDITLGGSANPFLVGSLANGLPGLYSVSLWSWRELYG